MYQKIADYVNSVFQGAPDNTIVGYTKKGFISSITKKYDSNLAKGLSKEEAFNLAISQTPEIHNVANDMKKFMGSHPKDANVTNNNDCGERDNDDVDDDHDDDEKNDEEFHYSKTESAEELEKTRIARKKLNNFSSIFWPLVVTAYLLYSLLVDGAWAYSWVIFVVAAGIQCIVRFFFAQTPESKKDAICASLWLIVVVVYLGISFGFGGWRYSWIIFLIAAALQCLVNVFTAKSRGAKKGAVGGVIWLTIVATYFLLSFFTGRWDVTWVIFIAGVAIHSIAMLIFDKSTLK